MKALLTLGLCLLTVISFSKNKTWTCINEDGSVRFEMEAKFAYEFSDGLARVKVSSVVNNQWVSKIGFVDMDGKIVIEPQFEKIKGRGFINGRAWVRVTKDANWKLIDKTGKEIPTAGYAKVGYIHDDNFNLLAVYQDGQLGFVDYDGNVVIGCQYLGGTTFPQGLACVTAYAGTEEKYGFINPKGEVMIPFQYKQAGIATFMDNGYCRANVGGRTVLIDTKGTVAFKTTKGNIQGMSNGWVIVFTKKDRSGIGYLNFKDEWMIQPIYESLGYFDQFGRTHATKNGLAGIMDTAENVLVEFKYDRFYFDAEDDGYIMGVYKTDEPQNLMNTPKDYYTADLKLVDMSGKKYIFPADGAPLMKYQSTDDKMGYLNRNFEVVIPAKYSKGKSFTEGVAWVSL